MTGFAWYYVFGGIKVSDWTGTVDGMCTRQGWSDFPFVYYHVRFLTFVTHCKLWRKLECLGNTTGELGYDGPLYDGFLHMTDDMLGPSPMHIKYSLYVYDGFCI